MSYQPSAINNSTPLHFTPPFWSCTAVAENRSDPMWLWLVVVNFIVSTAYSRATEPVDWSPSSRWNMSGRNIPWWSLQLLQSEGSQLRKEPTEKPTNEPRDNIFSQRDVLLGCFYCCRRCVLVDHENCRCPKIFLLQLLLLRPPKLHVQWSSTCSIIQTVYLAVKK